MAELKQSVVIVGGRHIELPPWYSGDPESLWQLGLPDISVADDSQLYPLGTKLFDGENVYKYGYAANTLSQDQACKHASVQHVGYSSIQVAALKGATTLKFTASATCGRSANGVIAIDELAGGYCVIFLAGGGSMTRQIVSNTASVISVGATVTLEVSRPISSALTTSDHIECMASPYSYCWNYGLAGGNPFVAVGMPQVAATAGQWFWMLTWGPGWLAGEAEMGVSTGQANNRIVIFRHNGAGDELDMTATTHDQYNDKGQIAGYIMSNGAAGAQGAPFIYFQISR